MAGDFDHDGFPDLAVTYGLQPSEILFSSETDTDISRCGQWLVRGEYVAVGDFNGDGIPDVVVPDASNFVSLALGRKDRNFASPLALSPATVTYISTGDINGDGLPEIFAGGDSIFDIPGTVFLTRARVRFNSPPTPIPVPSRFGI